MISLSPRNGGQTYSVATAAVRHWYWGDWLAKNDDGLPCEGGGIWDGSSAMRLAGTEHELKTTWMNESDVVMIGYSLCPVSWEARVLTKAQQNAHFITLTHTLSLMHTHTQTLSLSLTHTHTTNTRITGDGLVQWEENNRSAYRREETGFQFWLKFKRSEWRRTPNTVTERGREF